MVPGKKGEQKFPVMCVYLGGVCVGVGLYLWWGGCWWVFCVWARGVGPGVGFGVGQGGGDFPVGG